jgi:hypothetical protein
MAVAFTICDYTTVVAIAPRDTLVAEALAEVVAEVVAKVVAEVVAEALAEALPGAPLLLGDGPVLVTRTVVDAADPDSDEAEFTLARFKLRTLQLVTSTDVELELVEVALAVPLEFDGNPGNPTRN